MINKDFLKKEVTSFIRTFLATFVVDYAFLLDSLYQGDFTDLTLHGFGIAIFRSFLKSMGIILAPYISKLKENGNK